MEWGFRVAEWGVFALFALCARQAFAARHHWAGEKGESRGDGGRDVGILLSAALYAWLFEDLNVRRGGGRGAYSYNDHFSFFLDQVPLFIVLAWAVILWTSMRFSDAASATEDAAHEYSCGEAKAHCSEDVARSEQTLETPGGVARRDSFGNKDGLSAGRASRAKLPDMARRVASDAALAVLLDISFDATAIRHRFWCWRGVGFDQAWFGVPAGNFFGWLLVSLCFSGVTRALSVFFALESRKQISGSRLVASRRRNAHFWAQMIGVPLVAFGLYRALESGINMVLMRANATGDRASLFAFFVAFGLVVLAAKAPRAKLRFRFPSASAGAPNREPFAISDDRNNATSANATSANATSANATSANATSANATSANVMNGGFLGRVVGFSMRGARGGVVFWVRSSFHAFAIIGLLLLPSTPLLVMQRPALLGIAGLVCALDGLSGWWLGSNRRA